MLVTELVTATAPVDLVGAHDFGIKPVPLVILLDDPLEILHLVVVVPRKTSTRAYPSTRLSEIFGPYSYMAFAFPRAMDRTCGFQILMSFPEMDLVLFSSISFCCRTTSDMTRRS
jgi:hypothetical protein